MTTKHYIIEQMKKRETIQVRIDPEQKQQLFRQAQQMGVSPSELIRRLIRIASQEDTKRIAELEGGERDLRRIVIHILKCLQTMSRKQAWKDARVPFQNSLLPQILDQELYLQWARIDRLDQYYQEREELFGTKLAPGKRKR